MLLRRITKHIKEQNWFAVGVDFLIVVFGVFFGFQVTAWNEARTNRLQEYGYLIQLHEDISLSIMRNEENANFMNRNAEQGTLVLNALNKCEIAQSEQDDFATGLFLAGKITQPVLLRNAIDELKATGKYEIIQNQELRKKITELVETTEFLIGIDEKVFLRTLNAISEIESKIMVIKTEPANPAGGIKAQDIQFDLPALCENEKFKHAISTTRSSTYSTVYFINEVIALQNQVLRMLNQELSRKQ